MIPVTHRGSAIKHVYFTIRTFFSCLHIINFPYFFFLYLLSFFLFIFSNANNFSFNCAITMYLTFLYIYISSLLTFLFTFPEACQRCWATRSGFPVPWVNGERLLRFTISTEAGRCRRKLVMKSIPFLYRYPPIRPSIHPFAHHMHSPVNDSHSYSQFS